MCLLSKKEKIKKPRVSMKKSKLSKQLRFLIITKNNFLFLRYKPRVKREFFALLTSFDDLI